MTKPNHTLTVASETVAVYRKAIKHLYLRVRPEDGTICVSAPRFVSDTAIRHFVLSKWEWIARQRTRLAHHPSPGKLLVDAACLTAAQPLWFEGKPYRLVWVPGTARAAVRCDAATQTVTVAVARTTPLERVARTVEAWLRAELKTRAAALIAQWAPCMGVTVANWGIKRMKTRWGTCNVRARRIWLNLALIAHPPACLEYVVVHELTHLLERHHNARFHAWMDRFLPDWRARQAQLNGLPHRDAFSERGN